MKKTFKMTDLDCAHCAAKMEEGIKALPGVNNAVVSFLSQKVTIDAEDSAFESVVAEAVKICKKIEPDCEILLK